MPVPEPLRDPPEIEQGLEIYWVAYAEVSTDRPMGFGAAPIPWTAIQRWGEVHELNEDQMTLLHTFLRSMDAEFMAYYEEKEKRKNKSSGSIGKVGRSKSRMGLGG